MPRLRGNVRICLLDGRKVCGCPAQLLPYMKFAVAVGNQELGDQRRREAWCKRTDVEEYREMTVKELKDAGILKKDPFEQER